MSWQLALVGIAMIPLLILPTRSAGKTRWMLLSESQAKNDKINQVINETLSVSGSMLVKIFTQIGPLMIYFVGGLLMIKQWDSALSVGTITATATY